MASQVAIKTYAMRGNTMKRRIIKSVLSATCAFVPLALAPTGPAQAQSIMRPSTDVVLSIGRGQLVTVPGSMNDVFVANDQVADVQVKSKRQLYIFGKSGGETTVYASNAAGDIIWSSNVRVGSNIDSVDQMLRMAMPEAKIGISTIGTDTFLLTGTVKAPEDAAEAERLVQAFVGKEANVISRLKMATPLQVNLQVRIAEVSRSLVKTLGVNMTTIDSTGGFKFGIGQGTVNTFSPGRAMGVGGQVTVTLPDGTEVPGSTVDTFGSGGTIAGAGKLFGVDILGALDAGETVGLVTSLAQPNLTALSGETAEFLAGGEYPIPISQGNNGGTNVTIEYKQYGVSLSYTPTVLSNGRISLRVRREVSELSSDGAVTLNGYEVPALTTRRTETTVELGSGQSFMIAGLLSNGTTNSIRKVPGAGDMPILGSLFRSTSYRRGETELVIVITPYLVNPVDSSRIVLPTDGFNSPNELQRLLGNMNSDGVSGGTRPMPTSATDGTASPEVSVSEPAQDARKRSSQSKAANVPTPGFSLK